MTAPVYKLRVEKVGSEKPWSADYEPWGKPSEAAARTWALGFSRALGPEYTCTLLCDGVPVDAGGRAEARDDLFGGAA